MNSTQAELTIKQLGGERFKQLTRARDFVRDEQKNTLTFRITKSSKGVTHVRIALINDLYTMEFMKYRNLEFRTLGAAGNVDAENLMDAFERHTGLFCTLSAR